MANSVLFPKSRRVEKSFVVKNFSSKIEHFKPGQFVRKDFQGDESISIYVIPNGRSEDSKCWVEVGLWNWGEEEVKVNWWRLTQAGRTFGEKESGTIPAKSWRFWSKMLSQEEARLKAGALEVRFELELAAKVGGQENSLSVVKNDSDQDPVKATGQDNDWEDKDDKKVQRNSEGILKDIEVDKKVQSKKANIVKEEAVLKYHKIVIDLSVCHLRCSACKTRPRRCRVYQCSAGHLVCEACLPSLQRCPVCNTSLPEPHYRNLCAEQCIASLGEVD